MEQANQLTDSYYRCRHAEGFLDTFYDLFTSKSPAVAAKFAKTDFKAQKLMLRQSLLEMLCFDRCVVFQQIEYFKLVLHTHVVGIARE